MTTAAAPTAPIAAPVDPLDSALGKLRSQPKDASPDLSALDDMELDAALTALRSQPEEGPGFLSQVASGAASLAQSAASPSFALPVVGGAVGGTLFGPPGALAGAGIGSVVGNTMEAAVEGRPTSAGELGTRAAIDVGSEALGMGVVKAVPPLARGLFGKRLAGAGIANEMLSQAARDTHQQLIAAGHPPEIAERLTRQFLLPHQATQGAIPDIGANIARSSVSGVGTGIKAVEDAQNTVFANLPDTIANRIAPLLPKEEVEGALLATVDRVRKAEQDRLGAAYDFIEKRMRTARTPSPLPAGGTGATPDQSIARRLYLPETMGMDAGDAGLVDLTATKAALQRQRLTAEELGKPLSEGVSTLIAKLDALPDKASFSAVKEFRSELMDEMRPTAEGVRPRLKFIGAGNEVERNLDRAMTNAVKSYDDAMLRSGDIQRHQPLAPLLKDTNQQFADLQTKANRSMLRGWIKAADKNLDVGKALNGIFQGANSKRVTLLKGIVGADSNEWKTVRSWHTNDLLKRATKNSPGTSEHNTVVGDTLYDLLTDETKGFGKKQLVAIHGKQGYDQLLGLSKALRLVQNRETGRGGMLTAMLDMPVVMLPVTVPLGAAAGGGAGAGSAAATGASIAIGINGLSRLMANENMAKWIIDGLAPGKKTMAARQAARMIPRFIAELTLDDYFVMPPAGTSISRDDIKAMRQQGMPQ